jgi:predicted DNA binding CopG/RHH family protein
MRFEFEPKTAALNKRLPQNLLDALKAKAQKKGIPYTRYVRLLLENDVSHCASQHREIEYLRRFP